MQLYQGLSGADLWGLRLMDRDRSGGFDSSQSALSKGLNHVCLLVSNGVVWLRSTLRGLLVFWA